MWRSLCSAGYDTMHDAIPQCWVMMQFPVLGAFILRATEDDNSPLPLLCKEWFYISFQGSFNLLAIASYNVFNNPFCQTSTCTYYVICYQLSQLCRIASPAI